MIAYTANLQHGQGTDGSFNFGRQITALADADLIAVQERSGTETGWDAPMASAGLSQAVYRSNQIGGGDGNAIWYKSSSVTILQTYDHQLSTGAVSPWDGIPTNVDKSAVAAKVSISGKQFYFVSTHLCQNAGADSNGSLFSAIRVAQINELLSWANSDLLGGLAVVIAGDMNFGSNYLKSPSGTQHDLFTEANYVDLWQLAMSQGRAIANWGDRNGDAQPDMPVDDLLTRTHDTRRIDRVYLRNGSPQLLLNEFNMPDLRETCPHALVSGACTPEVTELRGTAEDAGVLPSDHNLLRLSMDFKSGGRKQIALCV